jgi:hypothetical protein
VDAYINLNKCPSARMNTKNEIQKQENFRSKMKKLFDIACKETEQQIRQDRLLGDKSREEDLNFLDDMRSRRIGDMGRLDEAYKAAIDRKLDRIQKEKELLEAEEKRKESIEVQKPTIEDCYESDDNLNDNDFSEPKEKNPNRMILSC